MPDAPAAPAVETPAAAPAAATASAEPGAWRTSLPEDIRASSTLEKYNDIPSLAKAHLELEKKLGEPKLPMPTATWTEKEYGDLYGKLGRPDKPEGYTFTEIKDVPAGLQYSPEQDTWFKNQAHKLGLSTAQAAKLRDEFVGFQAERAKGIGEQAVKTQAAQEAELTKLKTEYGPKWDASIDGANRVISEYGGKEVADFLSNSPLGNDPRMIRMMVKIANVLQDHSVITGVPRISGAFNASPAAAQAELAKMEADPEARKALTKASHPRHDELVKRRAELQRAMVPVEK
jgi:hypothetical protein